jgi:hypothetical protein
MINGKFGEKELRVLYTILMEGRRGFDERFL